MCIYVFMSVGIYICMYVERKRKGDREEEGGRERERERKHPRKKKGKGFLRLLLSWLIKRGETGGELCSEMHDQFLDQNLLMPCLARNIRFLWFYFLVMDFVCYFMFLWSHLLGYVFGHRLGSHWRPIVWSEKNWSNFVGRAFGRDLGRAIARYSG